MRWTEGSLLVGLKVLDLRCAWLAPCGGDYGSSVSPRQAQHCFCHPYNSRCCCHQQKNKQVDGGGGFLHKSEMKVRSGRERFSVQLVTSTELCSTQLYQRREFNIFFGFLTSVSSLDFTKFNFCHNPPGNKLQSISP